MEFYDVIFPLNLGPLTYKVPPNFDMHIKPGMLVTAEVRKSTRQGVVLVKTIRPPDKNVKPVISVPLSEPVLSPSMLNLLKWASEYYIAPIGLALKSLFPFEAFGKIHRQQNLRAKTEAPDPEIPGLNRAEPDIVSEIRKTISQEDYKTYLFQAPSFISEISNILNIVEGISRAIILVPEISQVDLSAPMFKKIFGERLAILHGKLSKLQKREAAQRIFKGTSDIVLGTRSAVFAPLKSASFIAVMQEHNRSYKNIEGLRYHARDMAVMRGYLEKSVVVLSSPTPSMESFHNTIKGKYTLLVSDAKTSWPRAEIINMNTAKKIAPHISKRALEAAASCIKKKDDVIFLINRKGYAVIQCAECNNIETCPDCEVPLVYHKNLRLLKCHYCNYEKTLNDLCRKCNGSKFEMLGAGTQRIETTLKKQLFIEPVRIDNDITQGVSMLRLLPDIVRKEKFLIGTKLITRGLLHKENLSLCVFLNPDINLHIPDFRSSETAFQEIVGISQYIRREGLLIIQTRMPESHVYKYIRGFNYRGFFTEELSRRKMLLYPPYSSLILLSVISKTAITGSLAEALRLAGQEADEGIEVIGPMNISKKGVSGVKIILKSTARKKLHIYVNALLRNLADKKNLRVVVDVDPVAL